MLRTDGIGLWEKNAGEGRKKPTQPHTGRRWQTCTHKDLILAEWNFACSSISSEGQFLNHLQEKIFQLHFTWKMDLLPWKTVVMFEVLHAIWHFSVGSMDASWKTISTINNSTPPLSYLRAEAFSYHQSSLLGDGLHWQEQMDGPTRAGKWWVWWFIYKGFSN